MAATERPKAIRAGIVSRLIATAYDLSLLFAVIYVAFIPLTVAEHYLGETPKMLKFLLILVIVYAYFAGFWVKSGATPGMRPWRLRLAMADTGRLPNWMAASIRLAILLLTWLALLAAIYGVLSGRIAESVFFLAGLLPALSMACMLFSRRHQPLHDLLASTCIIQLAKKK